MNAPSTPNRSPSGAPNNGTTAQNAALRGASLAFSHQKTADGKASPLPSPPNPARPSGALLAATQASRERSLPRSASPSPAAKTTSTANHRRALSRQATGGSVQDAGGYSRDLEHGGGAQRVSQYPGSTPGSPFLLPPSGRPSMDPRSTSFIAATLAASRSGSPSPNHTGQGYFPGAVPASGQSHGRIIRQSSMQSNSGDSAPGKDLPDTSPIPPTTSLISMFENAMGDTDPVKKSEVPSDPRPRGRPGLRFPTPPRSLSPRPLEAEGPRPMEVVARVDPKPAAKPKPKPKPSRDVDVRERPATPPQIVRRVATEVVSPEPRRIRPKPKLEPPSQSSAKKPARVEDSLSSDLAASHRIQLSTGLDGSEMSTRKTSSRKPITAIPPSSRHSSSSDDTFVSASSNPSPSPRSPLADPDHEFPPSKPQPQEAPVPRLSPLPRATRRSSSIHSNKTPSPMPSRRYTAAPSTTDLPLDSLTNAIVASSLASARHTPSITTTVNPPPVPARRRSAHYKHPHLKLHHSGGKAQQAAAQARGNTSPRRTTMLQTLRGPVSKSDDEDARRHLHRHRKKLGGGKKHFHHEGSRKRWREEVTPRERRRYEAVWASNRGLFPVGPPSNGDHYHREEDGADLVVNIVARDIWSRSRLPFDELAEVWDLVDRDRRGCLGKLEFVVGMWLIDQRLRGRKIPARVGDSVWDSARGARVRGPSGK